MKKVLFIALASLCVLNMAATTVGAVEMQPETTTQIITPQTEELKWYYRYNEQGVLQKRLWSITYGYWMTDWIDVVV